METIGDSYLCVSGLPYRNGNNHGREIANMALVLIEKLKQFRVPHLPDERVDIRIGIHTGTGSPRMNLLYRMKKNVIKFKESEKKWKQTDRKSMQ